MTFSNHNIVGSKENIKWNRDWFDLSKDVSVVLVEKMLERENLEDLMTLSRDELGDPSASDSMRIKAQRLGDLGCALALGIMETLEDHFPLDKLYREDVSS